MKENPTDTNQSQTAIPPQGDGMSRREEIMELEQQREEEQLRKVDKLRKHIQVILRCHAVLLVVIFLIVLQTLAMQLVKRMDLTLEDFRRNHPGGAIGARLRNE